MPRLRFDVYTLVGEPPGDAGPDGWTPDAFFEVDDGGRFVHEELVLAWLTLIQERTGGAERTYPYEDRAEAAGGLVETAARHSVWVFRHVAACRAMAGLLGRDAPGVFAGMRVVDVGGQGDDAADAGAAERAVRAAVADHSRTLTLTCGRLLTGVTIREWGVIGMLHSGDSATAYLQAAFRVQSPHVRDGRIVKPVGYVFDIDPNRALRVVTDYAERTAEGRRVEDIERSARGLTGAIDFVWHAGGRSERLEAGDIVRRATEGVGTRMLARKWKDPRAVGGAALDAGAGILNEELIGILNRIQMHADPQGGEPLNRRVILSEHPALASERGPGTGRGVTVDGEPSDTRVSGGRKPPSSARG